MRKFTLNIIEYDKASDAWGAFISATIYFFRPKRLLKTAIVVVPLLGGGTYGISTFLQGYGIQISEAKPMEAAKPIAPDSTEVSWHFSLMPEAFAAELDEEKKPIIINGQTWNYYHPNAADYDFFLCQDGRILVHYKPDKFVYYATADNITVGVARKVLKK